MKRQSELSTVDTANRSQLMSPEIFFGLDNFSVRGAIVFCSGWAFCRNDAIVRIDLESWTDHAVNNIVTAVYGDSRPDVQARYPRQPAAAHSGFYLYGATGIGRESATRCDLVFHLAFGERVRRTLELNGTQAGKSTRCMSRSQSYRRLMGRAWALLKQAEFSALWFKAKPYLAKNPRIQRNPIQRIKSLFKRSEAENALLIVDHDLGGEQTFTGKISLPTNSPRDDRFS